MENTDRCKKKVLTVEDEAQKRYDEPKKSEAENTSREIQRARQEAFKKAEDEISKARKRT